MAGAEAKTEAKQSPRSLCAPLWTLVLPLKVMDITVKLDIGNDLVKFAFQKPSEKGTGGLSLEMGNQ